MSTHTYRCPHCAARVAVPTEKVGVGVACTKCERPFVAQAPAGVLVEEVDGEWRPVLRGAERGGAEAKLITLNPDPYRRSPWKTAGCTLFVIAAPVLVAYGLHPLWLLLALVGLAPLTWWFVLTRFETLTITTRRSIWRRGILNRNVSEVEHEDVRNIQQQRGFTDQILGVGTVSISSAGQDDMEIVVRGIRDPDKTVALVRRYTGGTND